MGIRLKINLVLAAITLLALAASAFALDALLQRAARRQVVEQARVMLEAAGAMRQYTDQQVAPHLVAQMDALFLPQAVPAYAATESFVQLQKRYRDYSYKEATLNPTNPRDRRGQPGLPAVPWAVASRARVDAQALRKHERFRVEHR